MIIGTNPVYGHLTTVKLNRRWRGALINTSPFAIAVLCFLGLRLLPASFVPGFLSTDAPIPLRVSPSPVFNCAAHEGDTIIAKFVLENVGSANIKVLGAKTGCGCVVAQGLPVDIAPGARHTIDFNVLVGAADDSGNFVRPVKVFTTAGVGIVPLSVDVAVSP